MFVSQLFLQIIAYILGRALEEVIPGPNAPLIKTPDNAFWRFMNPGTSEMHFVQALDTAPRMRGVLALFEGVATGAADGYARISGTPAAVLLHLGPGLGNGLANLHNARRARSPIVNIVGEHATYHRIHDAPLTSDIEGFARPVSAWLRMGTTAEAIAADGADGHFRWCAALLRRMPR